MRAAHELLCLNVLKLVHLYKIEHIKATKSAYYNSVARHSQPRSRYEHSPDGVTSLSRFYLIDCSGFWPKLATNGVRGRE